MYYDKGGNKITQEKFLELFQDHNYKIMKVTDVNGGEENGGARVSTVWLGLDHGFGGAVGGDPVIFETMVFSGDESNNDCWRHSTAKEAMEGHEAVVKLISSGVSVANLTDDAPEGQPSNHQQQGPYRSPGRLPKREAFWGPLPESNSEPALPEDDKKVFWTCPECGACSPIHKDHCGTCGRDRTEKELKEQQGITVQEIEKRVEEITNAADDPEVAHGMEDDLWRDTLQAIADGAESPEKLAKAALETTKLGHAKWYA